MTEDEAKAVLSVLGPKLEWAPIARRVVNYPSFVWEATYTRDQENQQEYVLGFSMQVSPENDYETKAVVTCRPNSLPRSPHVRTPQYWYNTVAEAKAACEIHAATGQFPPGVEGA